MKAKVVNDFKYGFKRVDPVPTQEEVEAYYAKEFYDSNSHFFNQSSLEIQQKQSEFFRARWDDLYSIASDFFGPDLPGRSVFDIGFGFGFGLIYLKERGLTVSGLEPSREGVDFARKNGVIAHHAGIENFDVAESRSDIVTLINVLEHLRDPEQTILNIKNELLSEDGLLAVDVPNDFNDFQLVADKEYGLDQWWMAPPRHINYFSHQTLQNLLEGCGFEVVHCTSSFPLDLFLLLGDNYVGDNELGSQCHKKRVNFERLMREHGKQEKLNAFYEALAKINLGRTISIYVTPSRQEG